MIHRLSRFAALVAIATTVSHLPPRGVLAQPQAELVGTYCLSGVREVGSCFRFSEGRTFEYFLSYGAYDEASEGDWSPEGSDIILKSPPYDRRPTFAFKESRPANRDGFAIVVVNATGKPLAGIDVRVHCGSGIHEGYTQRDGFEAPCKTPPEQVALGIRMLGMHLQVVPMTASGSDKILMFVFDPADLGKKPFTGTRLRRDGDSLHLIYRNQAVHEFDGHAFTYRKQ